ncbi:hypothetical protein DyAD56_21220 [Dyella sp. AD56]|uniref:hypothetical protein n=1 Tax=Dyella sp. AD56 TaxID=1528744 RepID=UPI000C840DF0|nr:hypothetical protein [Dyella sp. AD56]PMQ03247.1 hypothetical protein DyAD56_21220 [Dyella sp. AD56]
MDKGKSAEKPKSNNLFDTMLIKLRMTATQAAGLISFCIAMLIAISIVLQKEPAGFAYIALLVFGAVPVALLLKPELSTLALRTPKGVFAIEANNVANLASSIEAAIASGGEESPIDKAATDARVESKESDKAQPPKDATERPTGVPEEQPPYLAGGYGVAGAYAPGSIRTGQPGAVPAGSWVMITAVGEFDAFKPQEHLFLGKVCRVTTALQPSPAYQGYLHGSMEIANPDGGYQRLLFAAVKVVGVNFDAPSTPNSTTPFPS